MMNFRKKSGLDTLHILQTKTNKIVRVEITIVISHKTSTRRIVCETKFFTRPDSNLLKEFNGGSQEITSHNTTKELNTMFGTA